MAKLSFNLQRKKRIKVLTILASMVLLFFIISLGVSNAPKSTKAAFTFDATTLRVEQGDILYIGKDGLQSERPWEEEAPWSNTSDARATFRVGYQLTRTLPVPANKVYTAAQMVNMNYGASPTGNGCPTTQLGIPITGVCRAILTDGSGAIIEVTGSIYINGLVYLGDRVVLKASNITIGPNGRIIGSGQKGGNASGHDLSAFGGLGAHNGGQTISNEAGSPIYSTGHYDPNDFTYYYPLSLDSAEVNSYFTTIGGTLVNGGNGVNGSQAECKSGSGEGSFGEVGIGGSGGGGGGNGASTHGDDMGAGGGGGGGYGIAFIAESIFTDRGSIVTVAGGAYGQNADTGGIGGPGGGGVIIMKGSYITTLGTVDVAGGIGLTEHCCCGCPDRTVANGQDGQFIRIVNQNISIKKKLYPFSSSRVNVQPLTDCDTTNPDFPTGAVNCFNPYALQKGDVIAVDETIENVTSGMLRFTDDILKIPYSNPPVYCEPTESPPVLSKLSPATITPTTTFSNNQVVITVTVPDGVTSLHWQYKCEVKS